MRRLAAVMALLLGLAACSDAPAEQSTTPTDAEPGATTAPAADNAATSTDGDPLTCWTAPRSGGDAGIAFEDVTETLGLIEPLTGMQGHAAAWGDVNGDGWADVVVGTFATARGDNYLERGAEGPAPDRLLLGGPDGFTNVDSFPERFGRTSGAVFADLDGDGHLDLVMSRNYSERHGEGAVNEILRNDGSGNFEAVDSGIDPTIGGRSVGVLDVDGDGLLDIVFAEDRYAGGRSRLYRNLGDLRFEDVTGSYGFPDDVEGLGVATGDLSGNGHTDLFIGGSNRLFAGTGDGLREIVGAVPEWETYGNEDDVAGAAIADVNRDGKLDLVVGHHFNSTHSRHMAEVPIRLYLNRTDDPDGDILLEDVTEEAGLVGLPTKAPHVEIVDLDNDGWPDILTTASADGGTRPAVFRHTGLDGDVPRFEAPEGLGELQYWVAGPTADIDRDGRRDVLLIEWYSSLPSLLLRNTSDSGHWIEVSMADAFGGLGTRIEVYEAGGLGDTGRLLGAREITASLGYTAGVEANAHFGLGGADRIDVRVTPHGASPIELTDIAVDRHIRLPDGC